MEERSQYDVMHDFLCEYLKSFILLGFDDDGNRIEICHHNNLMEGDAILQRVRDFSVRCQMPIKVEGSVETEDD